MINPQVFALLVLLGFTGFPKAQLGLVKEISGFTGFYLVLLGFSWFYCVVLCFIGLLLVFKRF